MGSVHVANPRIITDAAQGCNPVWEGEASQSCSENALSRDSNWSGEKIPQCTQAHARHVVVSRQGVKMGQRLNMEKQKWVHMDPNRETGPQLLCRERSGFG